MKFFLPLLFLSVIATGTLQAQNLKVVTRIMFTDTITDEGVTFAASSDDAEQENDAIDALFDDDIDAGWEGEPEDQNVLTAGMRFRNLAIPAGAIIDSAFITVWSHEGKTAEDIANLTIYGEDTDHALTFTEDALITDRPATDAQVSWIVDVDWELYAPYRTPDLTSILQEIVDRDGWQAGNSMAFIFAGENQGPSDVDNAREWESFENIADPEDGGDGQHHPERVPELTVYFTVPQASIEVPIMFTDTITDEGVTFAASSDDAEQENDEIDSLFDDDIDAGWEGEPEDQNILTAGMRFRNLAIPAGATIDSAYIMVWSHEGKSAEDVANLTIYGEDTDDAQTFTEDALLTDRPATDAQVSWIVDVEWELYEPYRTPDLSAIVQEVIDRDGWAPGNAIAFIFAGEDQGPSDVDNAREWESFENIADPEDGGDGQHHPERVPRLFVFYSSGNVSSTKSFRVDVQPLKVYPNPTSTGTLTIELPAIAQTDLAVYNVNGSLVSQFRVNTNKVELNTAQLPNGMYFVQAVQNQQYFLQKVVVKN